MPVEFVVDEQKIVIEDDGTISMPGYNPDYETAYAAMSPTPAAKSFCYRLHELWQDILEKMDERGSRRLLEDELKSKHYRTEQVDRYYDRQVERGFIADDLGCFLADMLKDCIKDEDLNGAVPIATVLAKLPMSRDNMPDILVEHRDKEYENESVWREETHTLMICETEIVEWKQATERRIYDIFYFETETIDLGEAGLETGPDELTQAVLDELGLKDPEPGFPDEWDTPKHDETGKGQFGVMYERMNWHPGDGYDHQDVIDVEIVIYEHEYDATDANGIATRIQRESGDNEYRVTLMRRKAPSERKRLERRVARHQKKQAYLKRQRRLFEPGYEQLPDLPPPHPVYSEWVELEKDSKDRPEDFEG
jgi:hypothetical protein